jgi:hypothetical protein
MQRVMCAALAAACLLAAASPAAAFGLGSWVTARATYYGRDAWPLHTGSCEYGFVCPNRWSDELAEGYDVTAVSDKSDLYGHCGECLEVKCRNEPDLSGGPDNPPLDRSGLCKDLDWSVKVKIIDTCPCNYPDNAVSNARWCCGDMPHLDLSQWVLEKLVTDIGKGVFGISYRTTDCKATIANPAPTPPLAVQAAKDPHADMKGNTDCGALAEGSDGSQPAARKVQVSRKELTTESTTAQRAVSPTPVPSPQFSINAITQKKDPRKKKMAVAWWAKRQQQYRKEGSTDSSGLPVSGSSPGYWSIWWREVFPKYDEGKKKTLYMKIWTMITQGKLELNAAGKPST